MTQSSDPSSDRGRVIRGKLVRGFFSVALAILAIFLVQTAGVPTGLDEATAWIDTHVLERGFGGAGLFLVVVSLLTAVGVSRQVFAYLGGYAFGAMEGLLLTLVAEMAGVALAFAYARFIVRDFVGRKWEQRLRKTNDLLEAAPFQMTLIVRLLPVSSNIAVNLAAGMSRIPFWPFFWASLIGHFPQTMVFAMLGDGLAEGEMEKGILAVVLFLVSSVLAFRLYRTYSAQGALSPDCFD